MYFKSHELVETAFAKIVASYENREVLSGVASGFYDFDAMTSGIHKSTLTVLGARPAMGKTAFVSNLASRMCLDEKQPVAIFTFDTSASQFMMRLLTLGAKIDANRLRTGHLHEKDWARLQLAADQLKEAALVIDDSCYTFDALANRCRELKKTPEGLFLVIIDEFQQLLTGEFDTNRDENKPEAMRRLKALAKELEIAIYVTSQLSRAPEYRKNKRPILSDFGRGAHVTDGPDVILFLYRDEYYYPESGQRGEVDLIIARQKEGPIGTVELLYEASTNVFSNTVHTGGWTGDSAAGVPSGEGLKQKVDDGEDDEEPAVEFPLEGG